MKSLGIVRKVDKLGRIVIPSEVRRDLSIENNTELEIFIDNDSIVLEKYYTSCIFCGKKDNIIKYRNKPLCKECKDDLSKLE